MNDLEGRKSPESLTFRYVWPVRVSLKKLNQSELTIINVSPKFSTVYGHVAFQWSLKLQQTQNLKAYVCNHYVLKDQDEEDINENVKKDYVAISLYYVDGPVSSVEMLAKVGFVGGPTLLEDQESVQAIRGGEVELSSANRQQLSEYVTANLNKKIRVSVTLIMSAKLFKMEAYLNAVSPTPFCSFLTANYRARACSKVWKRRSHQSFKRPRSHSEGQPNCKKLDLERSFNRVMDSLDDSEFSEEETGKKMEHLFKKLLISCCDSCSERRASIIPCADDDYEQVENTEAIEESKDTTENGDSQANTFECCQEDKTEVHDTLANMYFNKVALPSMEFIEDFEDFLIDAQLNDLPVLKRACERYLCGELNTKRDIQTSLLLNLLFLAMVFNLPVLKSMTLTELCERSNELNDVDSLLEQEDYEKLDNRIKRMSGDRSLQDLIDECKRFREQRIRVEQIF
ncbi:hypothetical protein M3Y97_00373200 [Aphelenchoides bicaudatus]|nr:hypothetical protein M3Y97_00373200 [Aphelenchoides bicaudatus]